jgi:hypothetical protein
MRRDLRPACLALTAAALLWGGCSGSGATRAAAPSQGPEAPPRSAALQHDYVASPGAHFERMAEESKAQEAARKAEEQALAATKGAAGRATSKAGRAPASGFPAAAPAAAPAAFPAPQAAPAGAGFPAPAAAPGFPPPVSQPAPEPVATVPDPCAPKPCIGGDPCVVRRPAPPACPPAPETAMRGGSNAR